MILYQIRIHLSMNVFFGLYLSLKWKIKISIYMKIEFNHAGYGRTIPMMYPIDKSGNILSFSSDNFPKSFNGDWKACNESMYIPVRIKYDSINNDFIYYFPYCTRNNNKLVFNLYEPRLNNLE